MKDIKSMIIGFLLATCMFLMMGFGTNEYNMLNNRLGEIADSQISRYQGFGTDAARYLVDTTTGQLWKENHKNREGYYWKKIIKENGLGALK